MVVIPDVVVQNAPLAFAGMIGALVRSLLLNKGSIVLWRRWERETEDGVITGFDLGIIASLILGAVVGVIVDQSFLTAFLFALTGPYLLEEIIKRKVVNKTLLSEVLSAVPPTDEDKSGGDKGGISHP